MRRRRLLTATTPLAIVALAAGVVAAAPTVQQEGEGSANVSHVANVPFADLHGRGANEGTDIEFVTMDVDGEERTFSLSGTYYNGLVITDITDPQAPVHTATYDCGVAQGDVQTFVRDDRTYAVFTRDTGYGLVGESACAEWASTHAEDAFVAGAGYGSWIADISDPSDPQTVAFVPFRKGSHNITVHPSGDYLYNSNSDLFLSANLPLIEITDISDLQNPTRVFDLPLQVRPGLGSESHDITFNPEGTRAYSAAIGQTVIINTEDPANPSVIATIEDPAINVEHQAQPVIVSDPLLGEREFLIVEDEFAGATGTGQCPNGGVHVYDITDELELAPVKVGFWNLPAEDTGPTNATLGGCTTHVFDVHPDAEIMTIAYYNGGVRVVDYSALVGVALGNVGQGMKELGWYRFDDMNAWSVKAPFVDREGVFHMYSGDKARGMDIYRVDLSGAAPLPTAFGEWLSPDQALGRALRNPVDLSTYKPTCLLGDEYGAQA